MIEVELTKEELWNYLFGLETIGMGSYGIVKKIDDNTCVKIYYKDIFDAYASKDINQLDDEIDLRLIVQNEMLENSENSREIYENDRRKLELLTQMGYINKVLYYKGYKIAIEMRYYKNYVELYDAINDLNKNKIKIVIQKIRDKLDELIKVNIFPSDLSSKNILVNLETLDIAFIDLDDNWTRYDGDKYLEENPRVKKYLLYTCNNKFKQIKQLTEDNNRYTNLVSQIDENVIKEQPNQRVLKPNSKR